MGRIDWVKVIGGVAAAAMLFALGYFLYTVFTTETDYDCPTRCKKKTCTFVVEPNTKLNTMDKVREYCGRCKKTALCNPEATDYNN